MLVRVGYCRTGSGILGRFTILNIIRTKDNKKKTNNRELENIIFFQYLNTKFNPEKLR